MINKVTPQKEKVIIEQVGSDQPISLQARPVEYVQKLNENPPGLQDNVTKLCETPEMVLKRTLLPGESVMTDFDCYFPFRMLPKWKIIMYCIMTLGMYLFVLLFRAIQRWFYRNKCCTPRHMEFTRGKMVVTSKGRIICWKLEGDQLKQSQGCCTGCVTCVFKLCCSYLCAAPIVYHVENTVQVYRVENIREVAQYYQSTGAFLCLGNDYHAGIKIVFHQYDHSGKVQDSFVSTTNLRAYFATLNEILGNFIEQAVGSVESALNLANGETIMVTSATGDTMHLDNQFGLLDNLMELHNRFLSVLPPVALPDIVTPNPELVVNRTVNFTNEVSNVRMVADDGTVTLPVSWVNYLPGESIQAVTGQVFKMTTKEWVYSILTLGIYYLVSVRKRKFLRSAIILTNKRLLVIDIYQRAGVIPHNLINFTVQYTSYFPKEIRSGYFTSLDKYWIEVGLETGGGNIVFKLYDHARSIPFAKAIQLATSRMFQSTVFNTRGRSEESSKVVSLLTPEDMNILPFLPSETIMEAANNTSGATNISFLPFCYSNKCPQQLCTMCCPLPANTPLCSKATCVCFPWGIYCLTCALRPFVHQQYLLITSQTIMTYTRSGNYGLCGFVMPGMSGDSLSMKPCTIGPCAKKNQFVVSWISISQLHGHSLALTTDGKENVCRRCVPWCGCGMCSRMCCPLNTNEFELVLRMKNTASYSISGEKKNHVYHEDPKLLSLTKTLDTIEAGLYEANRMERV